MRTAVRSLILCAALTPWALVGQAAEEPAIRSDYLADHEGLAAQGYDVVAYHKDQQAVKGSEEHTARYAGVQWCFASEAHRKQFEQHPGSYVPAYGGYCAFAVASKQMRVAPNPETFAVQDGRLLLFFNGEHEGRNVNTFEMWKEKERRLLTQADKNWPAMTGLLVDDEQVAALGYDVVAYFSGQASPGKREFETIYDGAKFRFASREHLASFRSKPAEYLPAFGGHCAFAVAAKQALVPPNPETFKIQDGRLLLFFNGLHEGQRVDTSKMWTAKPADMLREADQNWPRASAPN